MLMLALLLVACTGATAPDPQAVTVSARPTGVLLAAQTPLFDDAQADTAEQGEGESDDDDDGEAESPEAPADDTAEQDEGASDDDDDTGEAAPEPELTFDLLPGSVGPEFPDGINPLTGELVEDPALLDRRPVVSKISNAPPLVRPQSGVGLADIVFEHYAEGGLTRFSAVFYGNMPGRVGSIRSARLIDYEVVPMYQALLIYSGGSNGVNALFDQSDFIERAFMGVQLGAPYYWRDESVVIPHNLFASAQAVTDLATERGVNQRPELDGMVFHPDAPAGDVGAANAVDVRYRATAVRWNYDPAAGVYRRFSDGQPHFDATLDQQVTADNVVVIYADHELSDIAESEWQGNVTYGWRIKLWFEGDAVLFRDGQRYNVRWWRPTREDMIRLHMPDGAPVYYKPGNTWYQVLPLQEQLDPGEEGITVE